MNQFPHSLAWQHTPPLTYGGGFSNRMFRNSSLRDSRIKSFNRESGRLVSNLMLNACVPVKEGAQSFQKNVSSKNYKNMRMLFQNIVPV